MRAHAHVVIIGAGIVGCSAAYHLAQLGWKDILVIDKGTLLDAGGATSIAPGLIFQTHYARLMTEFARYTINLLKPLRVQDEPCLYQVGGIEVATTPDRWAELKRKQSVAMSYGLESHLLAPAEVEARLPLINAQAILGGYFVPTDSDMHGSRSAAALAHLAMAQDVEFVGDVAVQDVYVQNGRVRHVVTDQGVVECEHVLLCTNAWTTVLAARAGLRFPVLGVEQQYVITEPLVELAADKACFMTQPILRHPDAALYLRQHYDSYLLGSYRHTALHTGDDAPSVAHTSITDEWENHRRAAAQLLPSLTEKRFVKQVSGILAFSNDLHPVIGQSTVRGLWVAFSVWAAYAGGVGKSIAELMAHGETEWDIREADINRFHPHDYTRAFMTARINRQHQEIYAIVHPLQQMEAPRNVRLAPFHQRLVEQQAVFFANAGWEAPQWYEANAGLVEEYDARIPHREGWAARYWSRIQGAEHLATRDRAGLFNLSTFTKIEVSGPGALSFLESICANQIDRPVGSIIYTALCNSRGGIMADLTVSRLEEDRFWILTGGGVGPHDFAWIRHHAPTQGAVTIRNMSGQYTTLGLWGPRARDILQQLVEEDISNAAFPFYTVRPLHIESVPALALRLSYAGELGWEIYAPGEYGLRLWDLLWEAGRPHGLVAGGAGAFDSLRLEKGYRLWGVDIHSEYNPFEAGLKRTVKLKKGYFLGRDALLKAKDAVTRKLCCLTFNDPNAVALGKEPILADGRVVGQVTSANYGYSVGKYILYGYLPHEYATPLTKVEVQYFDRRYPATVTVEPLFDPHHTRMKA
ncbi:MAG TPA: FAD-dependent oxidoreductase [Chloroflexi bacterium]|nr:FAD-dependent oxidoreductase [Chloroflexota bacterium]